MTGAGRIGFPTQAVEPGGLSRSGQRRVLGVLCGTELVSWGVLYYTFPVLAPSIAADTGWSPAWLTAAFSVSLVVAALVGIPFGRRLDRWGPRAVMSAGSVLAVLAVVAIGRAASVWWFLAAWALAGVAMAGVLYPPAFAALTRWWGPRQVTALTALTLAAGLASTVFAPLTAALVGWTAWRSTYLVLAVVLGVVTIPAHLFGLRGAWPPAAAPAADTPGAEPSDAPRRIARSRPFVLLAVAMSLAAFSVYAALVNLVPLLLERGLTTSTAALALGLGGVGQVAGRLCYGRIVAATSVRSRTVLIIGSCAAGTGLLAVVPGPVALLVAISVVVGAARGVFTLLQATAVSDRWGAIYYGRLTGIATAPAMIATAVAPWAGSALAGVFGSYPVVFGLLAAAAALAALLVAARSTAAGAGTPECVGTG